MMDYLYFYGLGCCTGFALGGACSYLFGWFRRK